MTPEQLAAIELRIDLYYEDGLAISDAQEMVLALKSAWQTVNDVQNVMDCYEDWFEHAPEDGWRFQRDLRIAMGEDA